MSEYSPVDEEVRTSLYHFPSLYRNRTEVLAHMLTTTGGGYDWDCGELHTDFDYWAYEQSNPHYEDAEAALAESYVKWYGDEVRRLTVGRQFKDPEDPERTNTLAHPPAFIVEHWKVHAEESATRTREQRADIGRRIHERAPLTGCYSMAEKYANLATFPDDVHADWLEAIEEIATAILAIDGKALFTGDPEHERRAAEINVQIAKRALERVGQLRAKLTS